MTERRLIPRIAILFILLGFTPLNLLAQNSFAPDSQSKRIAALEQQAADAKSSADNAWMLTSSALVLMMTGPGLALFYGGLVRKKNVLGTMMQSFAMMAVITVLWAIVGYSLAFGAGNGFIGGFHNAFLRGVGLQPDVDYAATIPLQTFMVYQLMFAIITPALITGAFAERMKFSAMLLFLILWSLFVYDPMAHMVWGKGGLLNASLGGRFPTLDFAGGTVVHVTFGSFGAGLRAVSWKATRISESCDAAAQCGAEFYRGLFAVGRLVWIQRRERTCGWRVSDERVCCDAFWRGRGGDWMERGGMVAQRQTERARCNFRSGGRSCGNYAGCWICEPNVGVDHRIDCGSVLFLDGHESEIAIRLR